MMLLTTFASAVSLEALKKAPLSYEATGSFYMTLNNPIGIFEDPEVVRTINEEIEPLGFDYDLLIESLFETRYDYTIKSNISPDYKKGEMHMEVAGNFPVRPHEKLSVVTDVALEMWVKYDFTDPANPVFQTIYDYPLTGKYIVIDLADLTEEIRASEEYTKTVEGMAGVFDKEYLDTFTDAAIELYKEHAKVTTRLSKITIELDNESFPEVVRGTFGLVTDMLDKMYGGLSESVADDDFLETFTETMHTLPTMFEKVGLFGENGMKMEYIFNPVGELKAEKVTTHFNVNIYDIMTNLVGVESDMGIVTKDNFILDFTLYSECNYTKTIKENPVVFPVLDENNAYRLVEELMAVPVYPEDDYYSGYYYLGSEDYILDDNEIFINYEDTLVDFEFDGEVTVADGKVSITNANTAIPVKTLTFTAGESKVVLDGNEVVLDVATRYVDGKIYVAKDFFEKVFKPEYCSAYATMGAYGNSVSLTMRIPKPEDYVPPVPDDMEGSTEEIVTEEEYYDIYASFSDFTVSDNIVYLSFAELEDAVHYTEHNKSIFESVKASVIKDAKTVTAGDKEITLDNPVIEMDGVLYVDTSFVEKVFDQTCSRMYYSDYDDIFSLDPAITVLFLSNTKSDPLMQEEEADVSMTTGDFLFENNTLYVSYDEVVKNCFGENLELMKSVQISGGTETLTVTYPGGKTESIAFAPVIDKDGKLYVDISFISLVLEARPEYISYDCELEQVYFYIVDIPEAMG